MHSRITLFLGTVLAGIAFYCFVESTLAQDALTIPVAENDDVDADDADDKDEKSRRRRFHKSGGSVNTKNAPWTNANENRSLAVTSVTQMAEAESVIALLEAGSTRIRCRTLHCRQWRGRESMSARKPRS